MTRPVVWSERESPGEPVTDCTHSAVLMLAVYGGWTDFPEGIYTEAERDLLERSDSQPDGLGGSFRDTDTGMDARYGWHPWTIPDGSVAGLRAALSTSGRAYAIAGSNANLDANLRRWDPGFAGAHAVFVEPLGGGQALWLDPLAPMGYVGDVIDVETVMRWAFLPSDARCLTEGELADSVPVSPPSPAAPTPPPDPPLSREERLAREVLTLRAAHPVEAARWVAWTGLTQAADGLPLQRETRLAAEATYLRAFSA